MGMKPGAGVKALAETEHTPEVQDRLEGLIPTKTWWDGDKLMGEFELPADSPIVQSIRRPK